MNISGLQRSAVSFRRQGSSGHVWDDKFLGELIQAGNGNANPEQQDQAQEARNSGERASDSEGKPLRPISTLERSRSNGGGQPRGYRTDRVTPTMEPPSPKVSACGFCSAFGKPEKGNQKKPPKVRSR